MSVAGQFINHGTNTTHRGEVFVSLTFPWIGFMTEQVINFHEQGNVCSGYIFRFLSELN